MAIIFLLIKWKHSPEKAGLGLLPKQMFGKRILQVVNGFKFLRDFPSILSVCKINCCQCWETVYWSVCLFCICSIWGYKTKSCGDNLYSFQYWAPSGCLSSYIGLNKAWYWMLIGKLLFLKVNAQWLYFVFKNSGWNSQKRKNCQVQIVVFHYWVFLVALRCDLSDFSITSFQGNWYQVHCPDGGNKLKAVVHTF